jgi:hypothetical protein
MKLHWQTQQSDIVLEGPAELVAWGAFYFSR